MIIYVTYDEDKITAIKHAQDKNDIENDNFIKISSELRDEIYQTSLADWYILNGEVVKHEPPEIPGDILIADTTVYENENVLDEELKIPELSESPFMMNEFDDSNSIDADSVIVINHELKTGKVALEARGIKEEDVVFIAEKDDPLSLLGSVVLSPDNLKEELSIDPDIEIGVLSQNSNNIQIKVNRDNKDETNDETDKKSESVTTAETETLEDRVQKKRSRKSKKSS